MGKIIYVDHLVSASDEIFQKKLEELIKKYQRFGDVELQYQITQSGSTGATFSCLIICREKENE